MSASVGEEADHGAVLAFLARERERVQELLDRVLPVEAAIVATVGPEPAVVSPRRLSHGS